MGGKQGHHVVHSLGHVVGPISPLWVQLMQTLHLQNRLGLKLTIKGTPMRSRYGAVGKHEIHNTDL
jgi:hypothetical protein